MPTYPMLFSTPGIYGLIWLSIYKILASTFDPPIFMGIVSPPPPNFYRNVRPDPPYYIRHWRIIGECMHGIASLYIL